MGETTSLDRSEGQPSSPPSRRRAAPAIELWRLRGATDELRVLARETSFGYALGIELDGELVLLGLQRDLESLVAYAERIHAALIAQGWQPIPARGGRSEQR